MRQGSRSVPGVGVGSNQGEVRRGEGGQSMSRETEEDLGTLLLTPLTQALFSHIIKPYKSLVSRKGDFGLGFSDQLPCGLFLDSLPAAPHRYMNRFFLAVTFAGGEGFKVHVRLVSCIPWHS